ncbi:RNA polymerase sigma factor [Euzebya pacifica]|uniref:RNA polymerase sigma factor n=1 Tax=Euzebya pacifica TaxID=1608957 RepID=UPI0030F93DE0
MTAPWPAPDTMSDGMLLRRAAGGDDDAFTLLFHRHRAMVRRICVAHGPHGLAEDLTSETFVRLLQHAERLWDRDRLAPWLATVARNTAISALRRPAVHRESPVADVPMRFAHADHAESVTQRLDVETLLAHADDGDAAMLRAHYMEGRPLADIARDLGTTVGSIKVRMHRARGRVRRTAFAQALRGLVPLPILRWRTQVTDLLRADVSHVAMVLAPVAVAAAIVGGIVGSGAPEEPEAPRAAATASQTAGDAGSWARPAASSAPVVHRDVPPTPPTGASQPLAGPGQVDAPDDTRHPAVDIPTIWLSREPPAPEPDSTVGVAGLEVETTSPPGVSDSTREGVCDVIARLPEPVSCHNER